MDKSIKEKWLTALRSGEFVQARRSLRVVRKNGQVAYCVLGVLRFVMDPLDCTSEDSRGMSLTRTQRDRADLLPCTCVILTMSNDQRAHSFKRLANYIEQHL